MNVPGVTLSTWGNHASQPRDTLLHTSAGQHNSDQEQWQARHGTGAAWHSAAEGPGGPGGPGGGQATHRAITPTTPDFAHEALTWNAYHSGPATLVKVTLGPAPICIAHSTQHTAAHSVSHTQPPPKVHDTLHPHTPSPTRHTRHTPSPTPPHPTPGTGIRLFMVPSWMRYTFTAAPVAVPSVTVTV